MTTEDKDRKKLSLSSGGTLSLGKTIETSQVKQSFSHGRSKTVQVERNIRRITWYSCRGATCLFFHSLAPGTCTWPFSISARSQWSFEFAPTYRYTYYFTIFDHLEEWA